MEKEKSRSDQILTTLMEKDKAYREAISKGDPIAADKAREEISVFLTEEQNLTMANLDLFSPEIQQIIVEAEAKNRMLHHKPDYKELN